MKITFKRIGISDLICYKNDEIAIDYMYEEAYVRIYKYETRNYGGCNATFKDLLFKGLINYKGENPFLGFKEIEHLILNFLKLELTINEYIESSEIGEPSINSLNNPIIKDDKSLLFGEVVDDMTLHEVVNKFGIENLEIKEQQTNKKLLFSRLIQEYGENILKMNFVEIFTFVRQNFYKTNFILNLNSKLNIQLK